VCGFVARIARTASSSRRGRLLHSVTCDRLSVCLFGVLESAAETAAKRLKRSRCRLKADSCGPRDARVFTLALPDEYDGMIFAAPAAVVGGLSRSVRRAVRALIPRDKIKSKCDRIMKVDTEKRSRIHRVSHNKRTSFHFTRATLRQHGICYIAVSLSQTRSSIEMAERIELTLSRCFLRLILHG